MHDDDRRREQPLKRDMDLVRELLLKLETYSDP